MQKSANWVMEEQMETILEGAEKELKRIRKEVDDRDHGRLSNDQPKTVQRTVCTGNRN